MKIYFLQTARSGGLRVRVLGAHKNVAPGDKVNLVADALIVRLTAKAGVSQWFDSIQPGDVLEVAPGRPLVMTVPRDIADKGMDRFEKLLRGRHAVFHCDVIPLLDLYCPCH